MLSVCLKSNFYQHNSGLRKCFLLVTPPKRLSCEAGGWAHEPGKTALRSRPGAAACAEAGAQGRLGKAGCTGCRGRDLPQVTLTRSGAQGRNSPALSLHNLMRRVSPLSLDRVWLVCPPGNVESSEREFLHSPRSYSGMIEYPGFGHTPARAHVETCTYAHTRPHAHTLTHTRAHTRTHAYTHAHAHARTPLLFSKCTALFPFP